MATGPNPDEEVRSPKHARILVIDDDSRITTLLMAALSKDGHRVTVINDPRQVLGMDLKPLDLILCDVMMPHLDGFALIGRIREHVTCPILFLTAKTDEDSAILAYGLGADDYLRKPFGLAELRAKVRASLGQQHRKQGHQALTFGNLTVDLQARELLVDGTAAQLTDAEYRICAFLAQHPRRAYSRAQIWEACLQREDDLDLGGGQDPQGASAAVRVHISKARQKLKALGMDPIRTIWSVGYQWVA
ncbi:DNA-binding response regulator [Bifidobacterium aemilianum]|uniref:DNA-binding response regulator n=1 Tax=Bifidobacterium aemilianum TaxID=2493120 RepID=A0A366KA82_9BIFI|nr:response regulator transcription factor [Bifidobacterium aemilianum]RBP98624.1 DNA-binding response regulator [Bifidobacterium aemilianum]